MNKEVGCGTKGSNGWRWKISKKEEKQGEKVKTKINFRGPRLVGVFCSIRKGDLNGIDS